MPVAEPNMADRSAKILHHADGPPILMNKPQAKEAKEIDVTSLPLPQTPPAPGTFRRKSGAYSGAKQEESTTGAESMSFMEWLDRSKSASKDKPHTRRALRQKAVDGPPAASKDVDVSTPNSTAAAESTRILVAIETAKDVHGAGVVNRAPAHNPLTWSKTTSTPAEATPMATPPGQFFAPSPRPRKAGTPGTNHRRGSGDVSAVMTRSRIQTGGTRQGSQWSSERATATSAMSMEEWTHAKEGAQAQVQAQAQSAARALAPAPSHGSCASSPAKASFGRCDSVWRSQTARAGVDWAAAADDGPVGTPPPPPPAGPSEAAGAGASVAAGMASSSLHRELDPITWRPRSAAPTAALSARPGDTARAGADEMGLFRRGLAEATPGSRPASARGSMFSWA